MSPNETKEEPSRDVIHQPHPNELNNLSSTENIQKNDSGMVPPKRIRRRTELYNSQNPSEVEKKAVTKRASVLSITRKKRVQKKSRKSDIYYVEAILDHRVQNDRPEYLIKWEGWPHESNTWEPITNLSKAALQLVKEFQAQRSAEQVQNSGPRQTAPNHKKPPPPKQTSGFDNSEKTFQRIEGLTEIVGKLFFGIKWKNDPEIEFIPACIVNVKIPEHVIKFYEQHTIIIKDANTERSNGEV